MPKNIIYSNPSHFVCFARSGNDPLYIVCKRLGRLSYEVVDVTGVLGVAKRWAGAML